MNLLYNFNISLAEPDVRYAMTSPPIGNLKIRRGISNKRQGGSKVAKLPHPSHAHPPHTPVGEVFTLHILI